MAVFKSLTFDGINSLNYGIYVTGEAVYNAPERAVEMVTIPGRNGALAIDQGYFDNIEVSYPCGCFAETQADFAEKVSAFRNAIGSRYSYKRLTDEYNADEYRLGLYKSGLEVDAVRYGTAGQFTITFDCKPQRFLLDGDRAISPTEWSDVQTASGELVTIVSDGSLAVKSLEVSLEPIQAGSGTPSPSNVRAISGRTEVVTHRTGKNLLPYPYEEVTHTNNGVTFTVNDDGSVTANGTATANTYFYYCSNIITALGLQSGDSMIVTDGVTYDASSAFSRLMYVNNNAGLTRIQNSYTLNVTADMVSRGLRYELFVPSGVTVSNKVFKPMLRLAIDTDATYEPYNGQTYTTTLGRTVYGGTLDVVSGELVVDRVKETYEWSNGAGATTLGDYTRKVFKTTYASVKQYSGDNIQICDCLPWRHNYIEQSAHFYVDTGNAGSNNCVVFMPNSGTSQTLNIVYGLATPQTIQLTPQEVQLLLGTNNVWSDGEITVEYGVQPYYNPTPFASKPLIKVTGTGTLGIGEYILTITGSASQTLYIDCETMEIYTFEGTVPTGASSLVSINKNDFPVLEPGTNYISVGSGITAVTITPRWWRI